MLAWIAPVSVLISVSVRFWMKRPIWNPISLKATISTNRTSVIAMLE